MKATLSNIAHHHNLVSLFESSRTCPLCSLIVVAVPGLTEWLWRDIIRDILEVEHGRKIDSRGLAQLLGEWTEHLKSTEGGLMAGLFSDWEDKYAAQVLRLGVHGVAPALDEVIATLSGDLQTEWFVDIGGWIKLLEVRERYAIKGQISELAISLASTDQTFGLKDMPSGNLRVSSHSSMQPLPTNNHVPSYLNFLSSGKYFTKQD
jgi:hypothetical protein